MANTIAGHKRLTVCELLCEIVSRNNRIGAIRLCIYKKQGVLPFVAPAVKAVAKELGQLSDNTGFGSRC